MCICPYRLIVSLSLPRWYVAGVTVGSILGITCRSGGNGLATWSCLVGSSDYIRMDLLYNPFSFTLFVFFVLDL